MFAFDGSINPVVLSEIISYYIDCVVSKLQDCNWDHTTNKYRTVWEGKKKKGKKNQINKSQNV